MFNFDSTQEYPELPTKKAKWTQSSDQKQPDTTINNVEVTTPQNTTNAKLLHDQIMADMKTDMTKIIHQEVETIQMDFMLIAPVPWSRAYHIGSHPRPVTYFIDQADLPNDIMCIRQSCMCISHCVWDPVGPPVGPHFCSDINSEPSQSFAIHFS